MQTNFTAEQLTDPATAHSEAILRKCVHCGFCTATCPTYVTLGNELDSPRGRIYLIKEMLENDRPADEKTVTHIDRCLSCLACMTTCPSGVNYMHLVDHARAHIEKTYKRPWHERALRNVLAAVLPYPSRFRLALRGAQIGRPFAGLFGRWELTKPFTAMLALAPAQMPPKSDSVAPGVRRADPTVARRGRVAILTGCAQSVLDAETNEATIRLLNRVGVEVVVPRGETCCGALVHHMGREEASLDFARKNVDAWSRQIEGEGLDAIIITASGCGTTIKDYGFMLRHDEGYAKRAEKVAAIAKDITEYLYALDLPEPVNETGLNVTYHSACSMQHGQRITETPIDLLRAAGFNVSEPAEKHLCCGSAGTYNITQPEIAGRLKKRKLKNLKATEPEVIAAGNIGCIMQLSGEAGVPLIHTVKLLDWAYGGPKPDGAPEGRAPAAKSETASLLETLAKEAAVTVS
ncbi:glycolate oxidase iron-sulfur subunit [Notoacmeibacter marinus]|uniref:Glycolate oxidase iron-sulfur subunit n=1 Tax=Notoacmeibacter marinus TaxID=1876515 RepID=A0A231V0J4_9HYPH|nr:glycolate oxidase subunit GlcF [Notoacmeibacter marinus]OXT01561.1 glycolate oxidase iron-sulfur subunit [Notoacmeibacter marinus]